jgi:hypothetical protein
VSADSFTYAGAPLKMSQQFKYLGITMHETRGFSFCGEVLAEAGRKALFALQQRCQVLQLTDAAIQCKLFDALVKPILSYACEIWAVDFGKQNNSLERIQLHFLRSFLHVRSSTASCAILGEFGRYPLQLHWDKLTAKYWNRMFSLDNNRLVKRAFLDNAQLGKRCWFTRTQQMLNSHLQGSSAVHFDTVNVPELLDCMHSKYFAGLHDATGTKKQWYTQHALHGRDSAAVYALCPYLRSANIRRRSLLAQFRCSSHHLAVETGRWAGDSSVARTCQFCASGEVENESHFVFYCPLYDGIRTEFADVLFTHSIDHFINHVDHARVSAFLEQCFSIRNVAHMTSITL